MLSWHGCLMMNRQDKVTLTYQALLILALLPWWQYDQWIVHTNGGWGSGARVPWVGAFAWVSPLVACALLILALSLAAAPSLKRRWAAGGLPGAVFLATWALPSILASSNSPPVPLVADNMPQIWFFGESLGATMGLMLYLWMMSSRFLQRRAP